MNAMYRPSGDQEGDCADGRSPSGPRSAPSASTCQSPKLAPADVERANTSVDASGDQATSDAHVAPSSAIASGSGPDSSTGQMNTLTGMIAPSPDTLTKAMRDPSGDQVGEPSRTHSGGSQYVNARGFDPS